jgi:hypothetical protein
MGDRHFVARRWVYSLADYRQIFDLTDQNLQKTLLDFPGGISSVNAELHALGKNIVSADPIYNLSLQAMQTKVKQILDELIANLGEHEHAETIILQWRQSTELFLADYELGKKQGRYRVQTLPPFDNVEQTFELLLCPDFLFDSLISLEFSSQDIMNELCKLAAEVRIYPLPEAKTAVAAELGPIMLAFQQRNFGVEIRAVNYPIRNHNNAMLRIWAKECEVNS